MPKTHTSRIEIKLPESDKEQLKIKAKESRQSLSAYMVHAALNYKPNQNK